MSKKNLELDNLAGSGVLSDFTKLLKKQIKSKKVNSLWLNNYLQNILHGFKQVNYWKNFEDPAIDYLNQMKNDYKHIQNTKTLPEIKDSLKLKIDVADKYINKFRRKDKKELVKDLLILDLYQFLDGFKNRNRIISDLFMFFGLSGVICYEETVAGQRIRYYPISCKYKGRPIVKLGRQKIPSKEEKHKNCNYFYRDSNTTSCEAIRNNSAIAKPCPRTLRNIKQRLKGINVLFKQGLKHDRLKDIINSPSSKEYKTYEQNRIRGFQDAVKDPKLFTSQKEYFVGLLKDEKKLKRYIRGRYVKSCLNDFLQYRIKELDGFNLLEIVPILKELKIPKDRYSQCFNIIEADKVFLNSFKLPAIK